MYYIIKLADIWSIMEARSGQTKTLEPGDVDTIKRLLPDLLSDNSLLLAVQVTQLPPAKLLKFTLPEKSQVPERKPDSTKVKPVQQP